MDEIWRYTFATWGLEQADGYVEDIATTCGSLANGTRVGRVEPLREGYFRYPVGKHVVFYKVIDGGIRVMRVLHQRMNVSAQLGD